MPEAVLSDPRSYAFDLEKLLAPISVDRPSGESLRLTDTYDAIERARREDDATLPRGVWERELERADWNRVAELCLDALETRTKDAQVAAWLLEAWIHLHGFAGATHGLALLGALYDSFWDDLHPALEYGDVEDRLMPVQWINDKLSLELKMVPVTGAGDVPTYTWADWESALHLARIAANDQTVLEKAEARGQATREKFLASVSLTASSFYRQLYSDLGHALAAVDELADVLEVKSGAAAPSLARLHDVLEAVAHFAHQILAERGDKEEPSPEPVERERTVMLDTAAPEAPVPIQTGGPIGSRSEAYRRLAEAADYLQRTEPHSPAPYLIKRAVAWGGMTLGELLAELLAENADLNTINKLLGITRPGSN